EGVHAHQEHRRDQAEADCDGCAGLDQDGQHPDREVGQYGTRDLAEAAARIGLEVWGQVLLPAAPGWDLCGVHSVVTFTRPYANSRRSVQQPPDSPEFSTDCGNAADNCPEMRSPLKHRFDPPLRKRLLWQDSLAPDTLISQDRGLMARSFGTLALVSTLLEMLILIIHADPKRNYIGVEIAVVTGGVIGVICFLGYRRLPRWLF